VRETRYRVIYFQYVYVITFIGGGERGWCHPLGGGNGHAAIR